MSGRKIQPKAMTIAEMQADVNAAEQAARAEEAAAIPAEETVTQTPQAEPVKESTPPEPVKEVTPAPVNESAELDSLKAALADKDAKIAELTKRVRDEDGRNGGRLAQLQEQAVRQAEQIRQLTDEVRLSRKVEAKPEPKPEPDALETEFPELAEGVNNRTKPAMDAAARAEQQAKEAKEQLAKMQVDQRTRDWNAFLGVVKSAVPDMDKTNVDPEFNAWLDGRNPGTSVSRRATMDDCAASLNSGPVIELFQQWNNEKKKSSAAVEPVTPTVARPSKEAQVEVPRSGAASTTTKKPSNQEAAKRLKQIEDKVLRGIGGVSTVADREEYYKLLDAQERGEFT